MRNIDDILKITGYIDGYFNWDAYFKEINSRYIKEQGTSSLIARGKHYSMVRTIFFEFMKQIVDDAIDNDICIKLTNKVSLQMKTIKDPFVYRWHRKGDKFAVLLMSSVRREKSKRKVYNSHFVFLNGKYNRKIWRMRESGKIW